MILHFVFVKPLLSFALLETYILNMVHFYIEHKISQRLMVMVCVDLYNLKYLILVSLVHTKHSSYYNKFLGSPRCPITIIKIYIRFNG